jgi:glycine/D-amino acid oxidase-like deaminating enzyme
MLVEMSAAGVELRVDSPVLRLRAIAGGVEVRHLGPAGEETTTAARVFTCVYSRTNRLLADSGIAPIPLKHEITEVALAELPSPLDGMGVTVMCGPFFSFMPFPPLGVHSFTHVRYTPHAQWEDGAGMDPPDPYEVLERVEKRSRFVHMLRDARRYIPALEDARQVGSLWEVKTVLPRSEMDDSRPILFRRDVGMPGLSCIIGSKIDCIYDVMDEVRALPARLRT